MDWNEGSNVPEHPTLTSTNLRNQPTSTDNDFVNNGGPPRLRQLEELCIVCGDRSSGYHYNALTCEGCKAFFSRTVLRLTQPIPKYLKPCKADGACVALMDMYLRRKCPSCRYQKCLQAGMDITCVLQPSERPTRNQNYEGSSLTGTTNDNSQVSSSSTSSSSSSPFPTPELMKPAGELNFEERCLIQLVETNQEKYEKPSENDIRKLTESSRVQVVNNESGSSDEICYQAITELTKLTIELIVEFAKKLPGFSDFDLETQCVMLKACCGDLMMLRAARRYIFDRDCIEFANGLSFTKSSYITAGVVLLTDPLFKFCQKLHRLQLDNIEHALLAAICIFSERPDLESKSTAISFQIEEHQLRYVNLLQRYIDSKYSNDNDHHQSNGAIRFAKLLAVLTEAHELSVMNLDDCFELIWKGRVIPNLVLEVYGLSIALCLSQNKDFVQPVC